MKVKALIKNKGFEVIAVDGDNTIAEAINKMVTRGIGAVLVMDKGQTAGMFTERDVLKTWAEGLNLESTLVKEVMTKDLIVAELGDEISYIMGIMIQKNIRHMPVVDEDKIVSVMSIRDVVSANVSKLESEVHYLKDYISTAG